jgi:6-phosphogluconolactonase
MVVEVFSTRAALMEAAAERFVAAATRGIRASGRFAVALSGGSTPRELYASLAGEPYRSRVDWPRVEVFWGDERCVPPDHPDSNYRMAWEGLLSRVPIPASGIHRIPAEDDPVRAALEYERTLRGRFATPAGPPVFKPGFRFDLVLLGLGGDGHTASWFPGRAAVSETDRWVVAEETGAEPPWRVTLTPPVINAAREIVFLVSGPEKAEILARILEGPFQPEALPAQTVSPRDGELRWLIDASAAARLTRQTPEAY